MSFSPDDLPILYCDDHLVAVHKPPGLLVHRTTLSRRDRFFALQLVRDRLGGRVYPVHRLDRPTSGVLLFARNRECASVLAGQFRDHLVRKSYQALVRGWIGDVGFIEHPLASTTHKTTPPRPARTDYECLARFEVPCAVSRYATARYSHVELHPRQGRRHQLRRHLKHVFHPIVGDVNYGDGRHNRFFRTTFGCQRLMLTATALEFQHPTTGESVIVSCSPDLSFSSVLDRLADHRPAG